MALEQTWDYVGARLPMSKRLIRGINWATAGRLEELVGIRPVGTLVIPKWMDSLGSRKGWEGWAEAARCAQTVLTRRCEVGIEYRESHLFFMNADFSNGRKRGGQ